jgi:hypothetical protein
VLNTGNGTVEWVLLFDDKRPVWATITSFEGVLALLGVPAVDGASSSLPLTSSRRGLCRRWSRVAG